ncbi:probable 39S ribosomal protein L23, mitochondrial [Ctenocephalides felis]|uniref:probable 39S ribosomal protein L23, mitochondrial n=1 Tax=Ctenocephalides felis TaxID=7515 RepID=UPI000E6E48BD|nr:probable 39S ribosomal protein L23, mitochondrial [Ctenocephalides felis]XP_026466347.1 probable 39S ribosomal protein L23, mitochondrial [Ctenocephalides felis]
MSTRWYPLYQRGNPQLRVFLPNFWLKLIRPVHEQPPNVVQFACSMQMTKYDIKNYLEKIYNVPIIDVRTRIQLGKTKRDLKGYIVKEEDTKLAYVTLPKEEVFEFPNIFKKDEESQYQEDMKSMNESKKLYKNYLERNKNSPGTPGWFSF